MAISVDQIKGEYDRLLKNKLKYHEKWARNERFYAGEQWNEATDKTKNLPRPVFNLISRIVDHKVSSVMQENIRLFYNIFNGDEKSVEIATQMTAHAEQIWEENKQNKLNEQILLTAALTGEACIHYFWNPHYVGGQSSTQSEFIGRIESEEIDPVNLFFANVNQSDIQRQPYILITKRTDIKTIKEMAKKNGLSPAGSAAIK